jgi:hypothetical protein
MPAFPRFKGNYSGKAITQLQNRHIADSALRHIPIRINQIIGSKFKFGFAVMF